MKEKTTRTIRCAECSGPLTVHVDNVGTYAWDVCGDCLDKEHRRFVGTMRALARQQAERWEVVVGNIGTVYVGTDEREARSTFNRYRDISRGGTGQAAGEPVALLRGDEIAREYEGKGEAAEA